jgi:hypothetical protein
MDNSVPPFAELFEFRLPILVALITCFHRVPKPETEPGEIRAEIAWSGNALSKLGSTICAASASLASVCTARQ